MNNLGELYSPQAGDYEFFDGGQFDGHISGIQHAASRIQEIGGRLDNLRAFGLGPGE